MEDKEKLFYDNINLAYKFATKFYLNNQYEKDDAIQIAMLGLWKACLTYDSSKGYTLATYACKIMQNDFFVLYRKSKRKKVTGATVVSLDTQLDEESGLELRDLIIDSSEDDIIDEICYNQIIDSITCLTEKELKVFKLITQGYTQTKVSELMGVSQAQISRLWNNAIKKLRENFDKGSIN